MAVKETSYYGTLETLLNEVGDQLNPFVKTIINTKNIGSGIPDGGFFTKDQFSANESDFKAFISTPPSRGVLEIKSTEEKLEEIVKSDQVKKYLQRYQQVLVTNYYQFQLVTISEKGAVQLNEKYELANSKEEFWDKADSPKDFAKANEEEFIQFLLRVMMHLAPLNEPKDVAWFLASYARDARNRIQRLDLPALDDVKHALEDSIGISFPDKKGDYFFKSTLVQTIFYGVFSSWVLYSRENPTKGGYDWRLASWNLKVPMIKALFERIANPTQLGRLGIVDLLDYTAQVLNRIQETVFFDKFAEADAVLYFYEPFLEAFDPELRKDMGVWYTPKEVVTYMVEKVDAQLKSELGIKRGLADKNVYVLDPACGTGAFLVEILKRIHKTFEDEGLDALASEDLKEAAIKRVFGFEILPAPFVVSHLQLGILLQTLGSAPLNDDERIGVYLTNSLTGWEPPKEKSKQLIAFPEMQNERDAAEQVKREKPILVIMGNPPYNAFAGISPKEEGNLVEPYKMGLREKWGMGKYNLDDLYIRFFRLAERRIVEKSGKGIVSYISNFSFLYEPSFVVMREHLINNFDQIWIDSLNGDSRETGKMTPDGKPDPSVFSTEFNKEGIRKGATITTMIKKESRNDHAEVMFREFWGKDKKQDLLDSLKINNYTKLDPTPKNRYIIRDIKVNEDYYLWPSLLEFSKAQDFPAFMESRQGAFIEYDDQLLKLRMKAYFNEEISWEQLQGLHPELTKDFAGFTARNVRSKLLKKESYDDQNIFKYVLRPFDFRKAYYISEGSFWHRSRPELFQNCFSGNKFLATRLSSEKVPKGSPFYFTTEMIDYQSLARNVSVLPFFLKENNKTSKSKTLDMFDDGQPTGIIPNLSELAKRYLDKLDSSKPLNAELIWWHCLTIGYSPKYLKENRDGIKNDFPRIPLPNTKAELERSAEIGQMVAALLDPSHELDEVTTNLNSLNKILGVISHVKNAKFTEEDLRVTANWGSKTKQGIMPGKGKIIERDYSKEELAAFSEVGISGSLVKKMFGGTTFDIYLNENIFWKNIPSTVWNYHIGGYQVVKKWLSYREHEVIGRSLNKEEAREVTNMVRRISELIGLSDKLDEIYIKIQKAPFNWNILEQ